MIIEGNNKVYDGSTVLAPIPPLLKDGSLSRNTYSQGRWYINKHAKNNLVTAASAFYALILTIFSLVYELNQLVTSEKNSTRTTSGQSDFTANQAELQDVIFGSFMYGVSVMFLLYCYYDIYIQFRTLPIKERVQTLLRLEDLKDEPKIITHIQGVSRIPGELQEILTTGSLILKIGCIIFALLGLVYYAFYIYDCFRVEMCSNYITILYFLSSIFIIIQTHFIFCNWKIKYTSSYLIGRFGTMHLVATNLWTWFHFVFFEQSMMSKDLSYVFSATTMPTLTNPSIHEATINTHLSETNMNHIVGHRKSHLIECYWIECNTTLLGFMYTSLVEYSLIGATVMFIVWDNMKYLNRRKTCRDHKEHRRINFNNISIGVLLGVLFLMGSIAVLVTYHVLNGRNEEFAAAILFSAADLAQYIITIFACLFALYIMRVLSFVHIPNHEQNEEEESQELLDIIMLTIGLIGEMIYSGGGLFGLIYEDKWNQLAIVIAISHSFRLLQVLLQSVLIYISRKLRIEEEAELAKHPGKNTITFLLIANISMMIMNLHESENFGVSQIVVTFYGNNNWGYLVRSFAPLTIFYRFHSSVCLADIWTNTYSEKIDDPGIMTVLKKPAIRILYAII